MLRGRKSKAGGNKIKSCSIICTPEFFFQFLMLKRIIATQLPKKIVIIILYLIVLYCIVLYCIVYYRNINCHFYIYPRKSPFFLLPGQAPHEYLSTLFPLYKTQDFIKFTHHFGYEYEELQMIKKMKENKKMKKIKMIEMIKKIGRIKKFQKIKKNKNILKTFHQIHSSLSFKYEEFQKHLHNYFLLPYFFHLSPPFNQRPNHFAYAYTLQKRFRQKY